MNYKVDITIHCMFNFLFNEDRYIVNNLEIFYFSCFLVVTHADESKGRFPLPEFTARVDGCQKMHPSSRAVNSARELGP